jgi:hypothetical protein
MSMTLSIASVPSTFLCRPGLERDRYTAWWRALERMSVTRVDLPDPDTPVTATSVPSGKATSIPARLCSVAPRTVIACPLPGRRIPGRGISRRPAR